mgnify:CR=1 FL=1
MTNKEKKIYQEGKMAAYQEITTYLEKRIEGLNKTVNTLLEEVNSDSYERTTSKEEKIQDDRYIARRLAFLHQAEGILEYTNQLWNIDNYEWCKLDDLNS